MRHVRDGCHVLGPRDADLERGFQRRLVEARKRASRIRWLELSRCNPSVTQGASIQGDEYEEKLSKLSDVIFRVKWRNEN